MLKKIKFLVALFTIISSSQIIASGCKRNTSGCLRHLAESLPLKIISRELAEPRTKQQIKEILSLKKICLYVLVMEEELKYKRFRLKRLKNISPDIKSVLGVAAGDRVINGIRKEIEYESFLKLIRIATKTKKRVET